MKALITLLAISAAITMAVDVRSDYEKGVASAVWIEAGEGTGSGVYVAPNLILTAYHVVAGEPVIVAHSPIRQDGAVVSDPARYKRGMDCTVVKYDAVRDLALLRVKGTGRPMRLATGEASPGDPLFAIGCGDGTSLFGFSAGYVRQVYHAEHPTVRGTFSARVLDTSVTVNMGDSGGSMVDSSGNLAGMISGIDAFKNETYLAVSVTEIRRFMEGMKP